MLLYCGDVVLNVSRVHMPLDRSEYQVVVLPYAFLSLNQSATIKVPLLLQMILPNIGVVKGESTTSAGVVSESGKVSLAGERVLPSGDIMKHKKSSRSFNEYLNFLVHSFNAEIFSSEII